MQAHEAARDGMKKVCPHLKVGLTLSLFDLQAQAGGEEEAEKLWEEDFTHYLPYIQKDDFIGVQNYTRKLVDKKGALPAPEGAEVTEMGYEFYPEGIGHVGIPIMGYLHWSLLDNFEWQEGFAKTFGLVAVDRATQERRPKPSLAFLGTCQKMFTVEAKKTPSN